MSRTAGTDLLREGLHLIARFFDVATASALSPAEQDEVAAWLDGRTEARAFWEQPGADQRHGLAAARYVSRAAPDRRDLIRAALLHDVGKRHARLGLIGRSLAGAARMLGVPARGRFRVYLDHGPIGADELGRAGAEPVVVTFTRHHHDEERPPQLADRDWRVLHAADRARR